MSGRGGGAGRWLAGGRASSAQRQRLAPPHPRLARLRQEAREQEQRLAEEKARRALEAQAWAQLKEQEVLQLQVGRVSRGAEAGAGAGSREVCLGAAHWGTGYVH